MAQNISIGTGDNAGDGITLREAFRRIRKNFAEIYGDTDAANLTDTEVLPTGTFAEAVQDIVGAMVTGNTVRNITVTYQDSDGTLDFDVAADITDINVGAGIQGSSLDAGSPTISITTSDLFVDDTNNRVGINTNTPSVTLDVNGDLKVSGELQFTAQGTNNIYLGPSGTGNLSNNTTAARNLAAGSGSMTSLTSGTDNVALGFNAGASITEGDGNVAIGAYSLDAATGASGQSVAVGYQSLTAQTSGTNNTGLGHRAIGSNTDGDNNVAVGDNALYAANSPDKSTAVGSQALDGGNNTSTENTAVGWKSMGATGGGDYNTAVGTESLRNVTGSSNVAIGSQALRSISSGANNVAVGRNAGRYESDGATIINPTQSVYIGSSTESGVTDGTPSNEIVIGYGATGNGDNTVTLGNTSITETILQGSVGIGTTSPSFPLHVYHATTDTIARLESGDATVALSLKASDNTAVLQTSGTDFLVKNDGAGNLRFWNNGSERMRITSSGNVGINETNPAQHNSGTETSLHITDSNVASVNLDCNSGSGDCYVLSSTNGGNFQIYNDDTNTVNFLINSNGVSTFTSENTTSGQRTSKYNSLIIESLYSGGDGQPFTGFGGGVVFKNETYNGTNYDSAAIYGGIGDDSSSTTAGGHLAFYTASTKTASPTEKMRIDSSGNSTFYGNTLIDNGVDSTLFIGKGSEGVDGVTKIKSYQSGADTDQLGLQFYVHPSATGSASTELAMTIDHNKNVGIGTTSPDNDLHISSTTGSARFTSTGGGSNLFMYSASGNTTRIRWNSDSNFSIRNDATSTDVFNINQSGNVGIGTTSPDYLLHLHEGSSNGNYLKVSNDTSGQGSGNGFLIGMNGSEAGEFWLYENNYMRFATNSTERMRIDSSGNVGIGTGSPNRTIHIQGDFAITENDATPDSTLLISPSGSLNRIFSRQLDGNTNARDLAFFIGNTEAMRILSSGGLTFNGDTATANALDDYEEGTFTPEFADAATGGNTASPSSANGSYVKVGSMVTIVIQLQNLGISALTGANAAYIRNLPFSAKNLSGSQKFVATPRLNIFTASSNNMQLTAELAEDTGYILLVETFTNANNSSTATVSQFANGTDIFLSLTYFAD